VKFSKPHQFRSKPYLRWIRTQPCICSGQSNVEAAHSWPSSIGGKSSDITALPLTERYHRTDNEGLDKIGRANFERMNNLDLNREVIKHINRFLSEGHTF